MRDLEFEIGPTRLTLPAAIGVLTGTGVRHTPPPVPSRVPAPVP